MFNHKQNTQLSQFQLNNTNAALGSLNNHAALSPNLLLKSKSCLDKLGNRINQVGKYTNKISSNINVKCLQDAAREINSTIQNKIQTNFNNILNQQARVNLIEQSSLEVKQRQEATRKLMQDYWQKRQQNESQSRRKAFNIYKQNMFPKIRNPNQTNNNSELNQHLQSNGKPKKKAIMSSLNVKLYEKQKQRQSIKKQKEQKILAYLYSYLVHVVDYKVQNDTRQFLLFQKLHYQKWDQIQYALKSLQNFCRHYQIKYCTLDLQKVIQLIDLKSKTQKMIQNLNSNGSLSHSTPNIDFSQNNFQNNYKKVEKKNFSLHQLLGCIQNGQEISAQNNKKAGIRFYGNKGKLRAIIKIQAVWRGKIIYNKTKKIIEMIKKIVKIQRAFKIHLSHRRTKELIKQNCLKKYTWFKQKQQNFKSTYRLNQLTKKIKYEIHICSDNHNDWERVSTQKIIQKQNCYLTRIFKAFKQNPSSILTKIIFITATPMPAQIMNYYNKLLELGGAKNYKNNLIFMSPEKSQKLLDRITLIKILYYCPTFLKKIKSIINQQYAYIVPSTPSMDYIQLCHALDLPIYSGNPQFLSYLQTNSGSKSFISQIYKNIQSQFSLPYASNIYSLSILQKQLTRMIQQNPHVWRWILKIDNEKSSRGLAYIQLNKILPKKMIKFIRKSHLQYRPNSKQGISPQVRGLTKQIFDLVHQALSQNQKITIVNKMIYGNQKQFLSFFFVNGGIIQAQISQLDKQAQNICFCVQIQPDNQWKFISSYKKITIKKRSMCCYFDSQLVQPPLQIQLVVKQLIKRKCFGFYVFNFIRSLNYQNNFSGNGKQNKTILSKKSNKIFFNGMKCYLDQYSSASFMRQFISKQSNVLYIPYIPHQNIKKITMSTFFHLCRLQNISFDIERKIGNIFMFLDGLQSGCLGIMTFNNNSKIETFIHAAEVLDFFSNKIDHSVLSGPSQQFLIIRNSINGYLNHLRRKALAIKSNLNMKPSSSGSIQKRKKPQSYKDKQYLT